MAHPECRLLGLGLVAILLLPHLSWKPLPLPDRPQGGLATVLALGAPGSGARLLFSGLYQYCSSC